MKLLDLPLELVRSIIETTVQDVGLRSSARLREVCKTFDNEVMRSYETLCIFAFNENTIILCQDMESDWRSNWGRPIIPFLARFVERRPTEANWESTIDGLELWQTSLPCLLNRILDDLNVDAKDRFEALVCLLEYRDDRRRTGGDYDSNFPGIILDLLHQRFCPVSEEQPPFKHLSIHVLTGAILLKKQEQTSEMWADHPLSAKFAEPFWAAIKSRQYDLAISQLKSLSPPSSHRTWSDVIMASVETCDIDMAQQLLRLAWKERAASSNRLERALIRCAELGDSKMGKLFIDTAIENGADSRRFGDGFRKALFRSILFGDLPFVKVLHSHRGSLDLQDLTGGSGVCPICVAAWTGRIEVLQWFIDEENSLRRGHILSAFAAAIQGDKVESLRCLIKGLFDDEDEAIDLEDRYWNWPNQIIEGLHLRSYRSVQYLLDETFVIASPEDYEKVLSMVLMGGHIEVLEGLIDFGDPLDEPLVTQNDYDWTPIMYAHASAEPGARLIEQRLYQLGIEPVDMTKAQYREDFERQRNQPVPSYTSAMPLSLRLTDIKQEPAKNVLYINGPRQVDCGHDVDH